MIVNADVRKYVMCGMLGENEARTICFNVSDILAEFPGVSFVVVNQRPYDDSGYPVNDQYIEIIGDKIYWTLQSGDLAQSGTGECSIVAYEDSVIKKTVKYRTHIGEALDDNEEPPEPWESWVQEVVDAANRADEATVHAPTIIDDIWYVWSQSEEDYVSTGVHAQGDKGDKGDTGSQGERGEKGDSVLVGVLISGDDYILESEVS